MGASVKISFIMSSSSSTSFPFIVFRLSRTGLETIELLETGPNGFLSSRLPSLSFSLRRSDLSGDLDLRLSDGSALRDLRWLLARFLASCSSSTSSGMLRFLLFAGCVPGQVGRAGAFELPSAGVFWPSGTG